jgi:serine/threonine protein kinase/tetratricopeptide (TPR) repeat protein
MPGATMMSERSEQAKSIFLEAIDQYAPEQWPAFLKQACGPDEVLRAEVERLLRAQVEIGSFHEQSRVTAGVTTDQPIMERSGNIIGPYKLVEQIGEGGMGTVWMAQQTEPVKRVVALKLIKTGMDSKQVIARFEAERQALALMDHPNIARVLDAGTTSAGRPYFVMDLVKGVPFTKYCDEHHLTPRQRLELFIPVCQAVQHAHQKGIIHRDLKPSNVLVARCDDTAIPKVIDFGVAKAAGQSLTERTLFTGFGNIVGTLEYMSPEQAEITQIDIDTRSDIYSLGVLLYELLTGSPPFSRKELERGGMLELLRVIREQEPSKPSTKLSTAEGLPTLAANRGTEPAKLTKLVRGELDWIVMKALEKDRNRRYETANSFALDVQRYLADEPVLAGPPSFGYKARKFVRRHRGPVLAVSLVIMALLAGIIGTTIGLLHAIRARKDAVAAQDAEAEQRRTADEERAVAQAVNDFLQKDLLEQVDLEKQPGGPGVDVPRNPDIKVRSVLDRAANSIEGRFANQPRVEAAIRLTIAKAYFALGLYDQAGLHVERSVALRVAHLGADHPETLTSQDALADSYITRGFFDRGEALFQENLEKRTATLGADHLDTLASKHIMASLYGQRGKLDQAEPLHQEVVQKREAQLGADNQLTLRSKSNLAWLHHRRGEHARAEAEYVDLIKTYESKWGEDHLGTVLSKSNLGLVYSSQRKYQAAEPLLREVLAKRIALQGADHPATVNSKVILGSVYLMQRKIDQAEPLLEQAVASSKDGLGERHYYTLHAMKYLARSYRLSGKHELALPLCEHVLATLQQTPPPNDLETLEVMDELASLYVEAKMPQNAITLCEQALAKFGRDDPKTLNTRANLAGALLQAGQMEKAFPFVRAFVEGQRKQVGEESRQFRDALNFICGELLDHKQYAEVEPYLRELLAILERTTPDAWITFQTKHELGAALLSQNKYAEAEPMLRAGFEGMKQRETKVPRLVKPRLVESLELLVQLYEATNQPDEVAKWRKELEQQQRELSSQESENQPN